MTATRGYARLLPGLLLLAMLAGGCGGGGGSAGRGDEKFKPGSPTGELAVEITGLPPDVPAAVRVTGPDSLALELRESQTLARLAPGSYRVAGIPVFADLVNYDPSPAMQSVTVAAGATTVVSITYVHRHGQLAMRVRRVNKFARNAI